MVRATAARSLTCSYALARKQQCFQKSHSLTQPTQHIRHILQLSARSSRVSEPDGLTVSRSHGDSLEPSRRLLCPLDESSLL